MVYESLFWCFKDVRIVIRESRPYSVEVVWWQGLIVDFCFTVLINQHLIEYSIYIIPKPQTTQFSRNLFITRTRCSCYLLFCIFQCFYIQRPHRFVGIIGVLSRNYRFNSLFVIFKVKTVTCVENLKKIKKWLPNFGKVMTKRSTLYLPTLLLF